MAQSRPPSSSSSSKPLLPQPPNITSNTGAGNNGGKREATRGWVTLRRIAGSNNRRRNAIAETLGSRHHPHAQSRDATTDMSTNKYIGTCMQLCCTKPKPSCASVRFGKVSDNTTGSTRSQRYTYLPSIHAIPPVVTWQDRFAAFSVPLTHVLRRTKGGPEK